MKRSDDTQEGSARGFRMYWNRRSSFVILSILVAVTAVMGIVPVTEAQQRWSELEYPELTPFERPEVEVFELDNGIRFFLLKDDELPVINLTVLVRASGIQVPSGKEGLNRVFAEVMRTGGTESTPADRMQELLEDHAVRLDVSVGLQSTEIRMNMLREDVGRMVPLMVELLTEPALPERYIVQETTRMRSLISRRNDDSGDIARREFRRLIYGPESVYARIMEYYTIDRIEREDLVRFHRRGFVGNNLLIGVTGDFETGEMKRLLEEHFGEVPAGDSTDLRFPEVDRNIPSGIHFVDKRDINQSYILMGHLGGLRENPDYAALQVMNQVLSGGFSGRLFRIVRSEMGLAYAVFGSYGSNLFYPGLFTAGVMTRSEATADAVEAVIDQIERLRDEPVREEELQRTRDRFLNSLVFEYESREALLRQRMRYDYAGMDPDSFEQYVEEVREVTVEDIHRVAREYLRPDGMAILVVGHGGEIGGQMERFGEVNRIDITIPEEEP